METKTSFIEHWVEITSSQCRMARAALKLGVRELAQAANVSTNTITRLEQDEPLRQRTVQTIKSALERLGIILIARDQSGGPGVRIAPWYSEALLPALKLGFTPPKLVAVSDDGILLEAADKFHRITIKVDRADLARGVEHIVEKQIDDSVLIDIAVITLLASKKYINKEYTFTSLGGERILQIELGAQDFENEINLY